MVGAEGCVLGGLTTVSTVSKASGGAAAPAGGVTALGAGPELGAAVVLEAVVLAGCTAA
jgi:hypothetical protein